MSITGRVQISPDIESLAREAAEYLVTHINCGRHIYRLALSGGTTPRLLYQMLASPEFVSRIPWQKVELFWGDERFVSWEHKDSNFRMVRETLLSNPLIAPRLINGIPTDTTLEDCVARYETTLQEYYGASVINPEQPFFDCVLLGIGADGHIASLLPNQPVLNERQAWVAGVPKGREESRITLTYPLLESGRTVMFLAAGAAKAEMVARARAGDTNLPAARLKPHGETIWFLDTAAAQ